MLVQGGWYYPVVNRPISRPMPNMPSAGDNDGNKIVTKSLSSNPMTAEDIARMDNDLSTMLWADMRGGNAYKVGPYRPSLFGNGKGVTGPAKTKSCVSKNFW